ncbi:MAG: hypothetical protein COV34_03275 [Candidatus Zambryskibacteria bacterium CG10_big_fil_rev_8_21_14_0_10_42_12]|uniref:Type I restriction modification DNA specificity domain-containing protein n=1 Tax=Candidatus Zambryskibacteria bacterium CG10_big_fil_rev_8_21_14_0_10_42_12 TaxID=1975115 RepID=A0A2H0QSR6_9BACT|nr:MAG: hypothetical protein COV34_03275 [Candidatus Zambryskibacteria bacterium CG10_big_fil_rev_8_21_14_0_10_42_12]
MVKTQTKNQNVFWLWNVNVDFQKRGDVGYWLISQLSPVITSFSNKISDVAELSDIKFNPITSPDDKFYYIDISNIDISDGSYVKTEIKNVNAPSRARKKVELLDVIVSTVRPNRNATSIILENTGNLVCSTGFAVIKSKKINPYYLFIFTKTPYFINQLVRQTSATMYPAVNEKDILNAGLFIPPLKDQQKVEQIVKEVFKLKKEAEEDYKKCQQLLDDILGLNRITKILQVAFWRWSDEINIIARIDPNYYQSYFQELKISRKKLKTVKLETLASLVDYGTVPTSPDAPPEFGTPYLTGKNIRPNELVLDKLDYLYTDTTKAIKNKAIKVDDVVITQMGTVGNAAVMGKKQEGWFFGSFLIRIRPNKSISPEWLALVINSDFGKQQIQQAMTTATVRTNTDLPTIKGLEMPIIDKKKENEIVNLYIQSREKKTLSKQKFQEVKELVENLIKKPQI